MRSICGGKFPLTEPAPRDGPCLRPPIVPGSCRPNHHCEYPYRSAIMTLPFPSLTRALAVVTLMVAAAPLHAQAQQQAPQAASAPQVSPIDQFALSGPYLFVPRGDTGRTLNEQQTGGVELAPFHAGAQTAQWTFEAVPGTPFLRIEDRAQNTYLA